MRLRDQRPMNASVWRAATLGVVCCAAAGCGGGTGTPAHGGGGSTATTAPTGGGATGAPGHADARTAVATAWRQAATAMANEDGATACKDFTATVMRTLESSSGASCPAAIKQLAAPLTAAERSGVAAAKVLRVTVSGDRATIEYALGPGLKKLGFTGRSRLTRSAGRWLIAPRNGS